MTEFKVYKNEKDIKIPRYSGRFYLNKRDVIKIRADTLEEIFSSLEDAKRRFKK